MSEAPRRLHRELAHGSDDAVPSRQRIAALVRRVDPLRPAPEVADAAAQVVARLEGMGPLAALLADGDVTDVLVNGPGPVWVERRGRLRATEVVVDEEDIAVLVERIVAPLGRRVDPVHPIVDARLPDGSRAHVVVAPAAVGGPYLSIRRFAVRPVPLEAFGGAEVAEQLRVAVRAGANVVVSGATSSGKTTLLNALAGAIPDGQRVVTVEDAAELRLGARHVVRLEARPATVDGAPEVTVRDLLRAALRMRPDRLVLGELRGPEAVELLTAMNTGHDGSMATVHANSAVDALRRLELLVLGSGTTLPADLVREQLAAAVDLVVQVARQADGTRRVVDVHRVGSPAARTGARATSAGVAAAS